MKVLKKVDSVLNTIRNIALVAILASCISLCLMNIVLRYLVRGVSFLRPFPWVNEMMQMGAIWVGFLAAGLGFKENSHVSLESFVTKLLPDKVARVLKKIVQVLVLGTLLVIIYYGVSMTMRQSSSYLQNLRISNAWFYASIPVGAFYMFYDYLLIFLFGKHPFAKAGQKEAGSADKAF